MADVRDLIKQRWPVALQKLSLLSEREQALKAQLEEVLKEKDETQKEIVAWESAAKSLHINLEAIDEESNTNPKFDRYYKSGDVSIKQAARLTLDYFRDGLNSHELLEKISTRYFEDKLPRTSFSPQLSRLHRDGEVEAHEDKWRLTDKGRKIMGQGQVLPYQNSIFD